jgi:tRNA nucleotidyltransferase (CCA-adding enzyme)
MHLICTHEQADFDAVASLWAASLLDSEAEPVLPRRINRNVRGFLTIYGEHFAFSELKDLGTRPLERVTLVDTQSLISLKGFGSNTSVHIVDHHPPEQDLSKDWSTHVEQLGATATLLVEALRELGAELDLPSATLLLLGIYEDTGSLTYPSTTSRDVAAVAWLLERGASLEVLNDFINPPLTRGQKQLYEVLVDSVELHNIRGLTIAIAQAEQAGMSDEISTLAHKLGDLYAASGLFLLVGIDGGVQLVARSYSDLLDVGEVAERLGGGGHARAAAAMIKQQSLESAASRLMQVLEQVVEAPSTVAEIMSRGPQLLHEAQTVEEAAAQMQRYGHEGYPVTDNGSVVGLVTRRAVDRAMAHGMKGRPVTEIMEAGNVVVHPGDTVGELQRVMMEHQWGQIPVADPDSGEVIGIVTRTDVLNSLSRDPNSTGMVSLKEKLENALPPVRLALLKQIAALADSTGAALFIVGGFVRDLILGTPSIDFDLVVEGDAIALAGQLAHEFGGEVNSHQRFGTAKWSLDPTNPALQAALELEARQLPVSVDFVTARTEFYAHPTALPSVAEGSIKLDLHRRDFSINTLALRLDGMKYGQLLDYWGGGRDLREGQIRVLHSLSFVDDPTRMLRAVRLEQRLGFEIEDRTLELMTQALPLLHSVSGERIRSEIAAVLRESELSEILVRLDELGLLRAIHPALVWDEWLSDRFDLAHRWTAPEAWRLERVPDLERIAWALWVYRLAPDQVDSVCSRLNLGQADRTILQHAGRHPCDLAAEQLPSAVTGCLEGEPEQAVVVTWLAMEDDPAGRSAIDQFLAEWRWTRPRADGERLRALGLAAGPAYRSILKQLRDAWLDGEISTESEESALLMQLVEAQDLNG